MATKMKKMVKAASKTVMRPAPARRKAVATSAKRPVSASRKAPAKRPVSVSRKAPAKRAFVKSK